MSCHFNRKGLCPLGKKEGVIYVDPHLVSFEKIWVLSREVCLQPTYFERQAKKEGKSHARVLI